MGLETEGDTDFAESYSFLFFFCWLASSARRGICSRPTARCYYTLCQDKGPILLTLAVDGLDGSSKHVLGTLQAAYRYTPPSIFPILWTIPMVSSILYSYKASSSKRLQLRRGCPSHNALHNAPLPLGYCRSWWSTRQRIHAAR